MRTLDWRVLVNGAWRVAEGRWPGEEYHLEKQAPGVWICRFVGERGEYEQTLKRGSFNEVRTEAIRHYNVPL